MYLEEADFHKPIWTSYAKTPSDIGSLLAYLPRAMGFTIKPTLPQVNPDQKLSFTIQSCDAELPRYDDQKKLSCPGSAKIQDVIIFINSKVGFDRLPAFA